ncbi:MAG: ATP-dependent RecD-like DNA helicase [Anaerolineae bacterium]|nr:ATP-dependent RecD-like DNA helicase [Anaerolineae bacterium]
METLIGAIERITYYNEENGYTVLKMTPEKKSGRADAEARDGTISVVGIMPELAPGESVEFTGDWVNDPRYGLQFRAEIVKPVPPTTRNGIINYLSSGIVKGIGPRTAEKIVDYFGMETLHVLDNNPDRLQEVPEVKTTLLNQLVTAWKENQAVRQVMVFLQGYGISSRMAVRIHETYGEKTVSTVRDDPYQLADDVFGIGFLRADTIAQSMGIEKDARIRLRAGLFYALKKLASDGHTYAPRQTLFTTTCELLQVEASDEIATRLSALLDMQLFQGELHKERLKTEGGEIVDAIYLPLYDFAEQSAVEHLRELADTDSPLMDLWHDVQWSTFLADLAKKNKVALTAQQQGAVKAALTSKFSILTGGPGTGKTTTLRMVINALAAEKRRFLLASPTGRAAKRLSEAAGWPASTIHRMLGWLPDGSFEHDEDNPLDADMVIVDEASMLDLLLFTSLLKALRPETHLLLVGDVDQLPSVGAGNVLHDVIESGLPHVTRLKTIFRQDETSVIVENAHRINQGDIPHLSNSSSDFFFFGEEDPERAAELVVDIVQNRVPNKFGYDPINDIQVIAPMYRGAIGVHALNERLQKALNGSSRMAEKKIGGRLFRAGDKVMQIRNNYDKDVFNGDIGRINAINFEDSTLEVVIDGRYIDYDWSELDDLTHAYCISTHRSQGGEYPAVVLPIMTQHYMMLQRNLLYTAITRARELVVLVGTKRAVAIAVQNNKVAERYSGLLTRLLNG